MTTKEMIAVMQAYEEGKKIQCRDKRLAEDDWENIYIAPIWDWDKFDYRIKPEDKPERMTHRQLAEWCAKGNGQCRIKNSGSCSSVYCHSLLDDTEPVSDNVAIRPWGSDEWVEPTVDIYERDCKGE